MTTAAKLDLYQLTSLVPHWVAGRVDDRVVMTFFSRSLPRNPFTNEGVRPWMVWAGLSRCLDHLSDARFSESDLDALDEQPLLGPAMRRHPGLRDRMKRWRFEGTVWSPPEGSLLGAGAPRSLDGAPFAVDGVGPAAYVPFLVVETDLLSAKFIETPLLSTINHMTMVASKASVVARAARQKGPDRTVLEFGSRRTHPDAAIDASLAAWIGGAHGTSNVAAWLRHGVPATGTMDHFAVQAWEMPDLSPAQTEEAYFRAFHQEFPGRGVLLVDTYDTFGESTGIRAAVRATEGGLAGIRIDSAVTPESLWRARALLDGLGAPHAKIYVSGGMDEHTIAALGDAPVDGYGIGERIVTSPDSPVGVGAVAKLSEVRGEPTMKVARGSRKATLPGRLQVWRTDAQDVVGLLGEEHPGTPLLEKVWEGHARLGATDHRAARDRACQQADLWADTQRDAVPRLSPGITALVERLVGRVNP